jgi:DNA-binding response OmpR family regulator
MHLPSARWWRSCPAWRRPRRATDARPRARIEKALADLGRAFESDAVEVHVAHIRRKLGHEAVETLRGLGSRLGL